MLRLAALAVLASATLLLVGDAAAVVLRAQPPAPAPLVGDSAAVVLRAQPPAPPKIDPLVKPVAPGGAVRVRLPMIGKTATSAFKGQILKPKGAGTNDVTVYIGLHGGVTSTIQQWKAWGFEVPPNRQAVLPELVIPGIDAAPKAAKGRDVEFRLTKIPVSLYEAPGGEKGGISNSLSIPLSLVVAAGATSADTRVHFADRLIEFSAPPAAVKKLGAGAEKLAELELTDDAKLAAAYIPLSVSAVPYVSVNGKTQYKRPTGKVEAVTAGLTINGGGIVMSVSIARGCDVELDREMNPSSGKVKELRFGPIAGPGVKGPPKDFVLRDVTVVISDNEDSSHIWLSSEFVEKYFKDGVYAQDGPAWKLHGRVKPEHLDDQKNRAK